MKLKDKISKGIYVSQILVNGPAYNSDLKEGDLITKIGEKKLNTINDLREYIFSKSPKENVILTVLRDNKILEIEITLGKK